MHRNGLFTRLRRWLVRHIPRRLHTRGMAARARVLELSPDQRDRLRRNLEGMLRPEAA